jgi:hypothetical protein
MPDNGQVERMNRTLKEATVNRYYYETHDQLRAHLADFLAAYNFGRRLKTLRGLTPYEHICQAWTKQPDRFILDSIHQMPGLNRIYVTLPCPQSAHMSPPLPRATDSATSGPCGTPRKGRAQPSVPKFAARQSGPAATRTIASRSA